VLTFNFSFLTFHSRSVVPFCISAVGQSFRSEKLIVKNELIFSHTTSLLQVPTFNFSFFNFSLAKRCLLEVKN